MQSKECIISSNIALFSSTVSVMHNCQSSWAYESTLYFKSFKIIAPEVSNSIMTALLFFDLNDTFSTSNPKNKLNNPN